MHMFRTRLTAQFGLVALLCLGAADVALAQQVPEAPTSSMLDGLALPSGVRVTVGAEAIYAPKYEGAKLYSLSVLPVFQFAPLANGGGADGKSPLDMRSLDDISLSLFNAHGFEAGVSTGYRKGRAEKDSPHLLGLGDVAGGLTAGAFGRYNFGSGYVRALLSDQVSGARTGWLMRTTAGTRREVFAGLVVDASVSADYASGDYMKAYFGVTPAQASRSGFAVYDASAGFKSVGALVSTEYALTPDWTLLGTVGYTRYLGSAASSPITEAPNRMELRLGLSRSFDLKLR